MILSHVVGVLLLLTMSVTAVGQDRPNVVLLIADQFHHRALGVAGHPRIRTPNLDRLARQGARFTQALAASTACSPTRASWITGQWPHTHGITGDAPVRSSPVLDRLLHDAGYDVRHLGKWHLGDIRDLPPYRNQRTLLEEGVAFEEWRQANWDRIFTAVRAGEVAGGNGVRMRRGVAAAHSRWQTEKAPDQQDVSIIGRSVFSLEGQLETFLTDRALEWLDQPRERPFFLTLSLSPPHAAWVAPDPYYSMYDPARMFLAPSFRDRPQAWASSWAARLGRVLGEEGIREYLRCYAGQVTMVDELMGRVLKHLDERGLSERTLVVFTSDHGDMQGAHGMVGKGVGAFYDDIVRVPFLMRHPEIGSGIVLETPVHSVDLMPTILDYVGLPIPERVQGKSVRDLAAGTVTDDPNTPGFSERHTGSGGTRMIRTSRWKYVRYGGGREELFDLRNDPDEIRDLSADPTRAIVVELMKASLIHWMKETADPLARTLIPR